MTDRFASDGAQLGSVGYIIEICNDDAYKVEVSDLEGTPIAQVVAGADDTDTGGYAHGISAGSESGS